MIETILSWLAHLVTTTIETTGYAGIFFLMLAESANIPIPSEVIMPFSGSLVAHGRFSFLGVVATGTLGNVAGSLISYWIGRYGGRPFLDRYGRYLFISHHHLDLADRWFARYGLAAVFFGRLLPVIRTFISFPAGIARVSLVRFIVATTLGALPFVLFLTWIGKILGENWETIRFYFRGADLFIAFLLIVGVVWWLGSHFKGTKEVEPVP